VFSSDHGKLAGKRGKKLFSTPDPKLTEQESLRFYGGINSQRHSEEKRRRSRRKMRKRTLRGKGSIRSLRAREKRHSLNPIRESALGKRTPNGLRDNQTRVCRRKKSSSVFCSIREGVRSEFHEKKPSVINVARGKKRRKEADRKVVELGGLRGSRRERAARGTSPNSVCKKDASM